MSISPATRFVRTQGARLKTIGNDVAVYVPENRSIHVLNITARLMVELLSEPATASDLTAALAEATDGDRTVIAADVATALKELTAAGIVERLAT